MGGKTLEKQQLAVFDLVIISSNTSTTILDGVTNIEKWIKCYLVTG
jgi:hypothetical protein